MTKSLMYEPSKVLVYFSLQSHTSYLYHCEAVDLKVHDILCLLVVLNELVLELHWFAFIEAQLLYSVPSPAQAHHIGIA